MSYTDDEFEFFEDNQASKVLAVGDPNVEIHTKASIAPVHQSPGPVMPLLPILPVAASSTTPRVNSNEEFISMFEVASRSNHHTHNAELSPNLKPLGTATLETIPSSQENFKALKKEKPINPKSKSIQSTPGKIGLDLVGSKASSNSSTSTSKIPGVADVATKNIRGEFINWCFWLKKCSLKFQIEETEKLVHRQSSQGSISKKSATEKRKMKKTAPVIGISANFEEIARLTSVIDSLKLQIKEYEDERKTMKIVRFYNDQFYLLFSC